jgi:hypothetical protein
MDPASHWRPCAPPIRPIDNNEMQRAAPQGDSYA